MKNKYPISKIVSYCVLIFIVFVAFHLYVTLFLTKYHGISPGDIILIITAGMVFWYAWETRSMRKELVSQNEITTMPILVVTRPQQERTFYLENVGNFPAYNIEFQNLRIKEHPDKWFSLDSIPILLPKEKIDLIIEIHERRDEKPIYHDKLNYDDGKVNFLHTLGSRTTLTYENVVEKKYEADLIFLKDRIRIGRPRHKSTS